MPLLPCSGSIIMNSAVGADQFLIAVWLTCFSAFGYLQENSKADERTRTADLLITSELLVCSQLFAKVHKRLK